MKRIIRLTESDLTRIVKRVIKESEESVEIELFKDYSDPEKTIKSDLKREKNKDNFYRSTMSPEEREEEVQKCISGGRYRGDQRRLEYECRKKMGMEDFKDLVFGYKMEQPTEQIITDETHKVVIASKYFTLPSKDRNNPLIIYHCPSSEDNKGDGFLEYLYTDAPDQEQQRRDELWLNPFCDSVSWKSRVGKKRNIFRNPKI